MSYLKKFYLKELRGEKDSITGYLVIIAGFYLLALFMTFRWEPAQAASFSFVPLIIIPFWYLFYSIDILNREWKNSNISLLLGVPIKASYLLLAKMLSLLTFYLILTLAILAGAALTFGISFRSSEALLNGFLVGLSFALNNLTLLLPLTPVIFLIYLSGSSFTRWAAVVRRMVGGILIVVTVFGTRIASIVFTGRIMPLSFPHIIGGNGSQSISIGAGTIPQSLFIVACLVGILSFFLSARLLEERPRP